MSDAKDYREADKAMSADCKCGHERFMHEACDNACADCDCQHFERD